MKRLTVISLAFLLLSTCKTANKKEDNVAKITLDSLTSLEIKELTNNWKIDSVGCLRLRDPKKMMALTKQLKVVGKDSLAVVELLGQPNGKYGQGGDRHFVYFLECGEGKTSYYNFYCHIRGDTVQSFSNPVF